MSRRRGGGGRRRGDDDGGGNVDRRSRSRDRDRDRDYNRGRRGGSVEGGSGGRRRTPSPQERERRGRGGRRERSRERRRDRDRDGERGRRRGDDDDDARRAAHPRTTTTSRYQRHPHERRSSRSETPTPQPRSSHHRHRGREEKDKRGGGDGGEAERRQRKETRSDSSQSTESCESSRKRRRRRERSHYAGREGDTLCGGAYTVVRKLGEGSFARVMLCEAAADAARVAVKLVRAEPNFMEAAEEELGVLRTLQAADEAQQHCFLRILHTFLEAKAGITNAKHTAIVAPRHGPSLFELLKKNRYKGYQQGVVRDVAKQLVSCVAFIHSAGIVHTDLKPENVLWKCQGVRTLPDGRVAPETSEIVVIDFGSAHNTANTHAKKRTTIGTRHYRAPEAVLFLGWSYPADVWAVATMLVELRTGECLFKTHESREHLGMMQHVIGDFPKSMVEAAKRAASKRREVHLFRRSGAVDWPTRDDEESEVEFVQALPLLKTQCKPMMHPQALKNRFYEMIRDMLLYDPEQRLTCKEAQSYPFFAEERVPDGDADP